MSESETPDDLPLPEPTGAKPPAPEPANVKPPSRPDRARRWRRRIIRVGGILILVALLFRLSLHVLLPWTINRVAGIYGLNCHYEKMDLNLLGGDVGLWHVVVAPKEGGEPVLTAEYLRGAVSTLALFAGRLSVEQAVADGAQLRLDRNADGTIPLLDRFLTGSKTSSTPTTSFDLTPPLRIDALRLQHTSAHVRDRAVSPPLDAVFDADIGVSDLGSEVRPARFWVETTSPDLVDVLRIEGEGTAAGKVSEGKLGVFIRGIHPKPGAGYLALLGIRPMASDLSASLTAHFSTGAAADDPNGLVGHLEVKNILLTTDGREAAAVDRIAVDTGTVAPAHYRLGTIAVQGVRLRASRNQQGVLGAAGFELVGVADSPAPASAKANPGPPAAVPAATGPPAAVPVWSVSTFGVKDVNLWFDDQSVSPAASLSLQVPQFSVQHVSSESDDATKPAEIAATVLVPGIVKSIQVSATALPFAAKRSMTVTVHADGIRPDAIQPYLRALGISSELKDASFTCTAQADLSIAKDGAIGVDADVRDIVLADTEQLLTLHRIKIVGASASPDLQAIRLDDVEVDGPTFLARRGSDRTLSAIGLHLLPPAPAAPKQPNPVVSQAAPITTTAPLILPRVDIGHIAWKGVKIDLTDESITPPTAISLADAGVELDDLHINPSGRAGPSSRPVQPGKLRAWLTAPGLVGKILATGTFNPTATGVAADIEVNGTGIDVRSASPYLKALNIQPLLHDGALHLRTKLELSEQKDHLSCAAAVTDLKLSEGGAEILAVDNARIDGLDLFPSHIEVKGVEVDKPRLAVSREAGGAILAAGVRILPPPPAPPDADVLPAPAPAARPSTRPSGLDFPIALALHKLSVRGASIQWEDRAVTPAVQTTGTLSCDLSEFVFGPESKPANFTLTAGAAGILDALTANGTVHITPRSAAAKMDVSAVGVREGSLAGYLPTGTQVTVKDGRLKLSLDAEAAIDDAGAVSGHLAVNQFDWRDGTEAEPLFAFDAARIALGRLDIAGGAIAVDEVSLSGLTTALSRGADGKMHLLGLSIGPAPQGAPPIPPAPSPAIPSSLPAVQISPTTKPVANAIALAAARRATLPLFSLQKLAVNVRRVRVTDETRPGAAPLSIDNVNLINKKPIELLGRDPASRPPVLLEMTGSIAPVVGAFKVNVETSPFAPRPTVQIDVTAGQVRGQGLTELIPELAAQVDGHELTDGRFHSHLEAQANIVRHGQADFDFSHPFDLDVLVRGTEFRNGDAGPLLAGLDEVRAEAIHVDPERHLVTLRTFDLTKPAATTFKDAAGIHAMGLIVKLPASTTQPSVAKAPPSVPQPSPQPPTTHPAAAPADAPEIKISKLTVSGIDFRYEDRSVTPPAVVPLTGLDVDVRNLSSRIMDADRPVKFSVVVNAGKVDVPAHASGGAISGAVGDLGKIMAGKQVATAPSTESRDLFSEIDLDGQLVMYPQPKGYVKTSVSALELPGFRGIARDLGIDIEEGTFDEATTIRLPGDGSMETHTKPTLTDLSVSEPPNGPIVRYLHLPAPLDVVLAVLRDADGAITPTLNVPVKEGKLSGADVSEAAVTAIGVVVVRALAAAPVKAAGAVTDTVTDVVGAFIPLGDAGKKKPAEDEPTVIVFAAGATTPGLTESARLTTLLARLKKDPQLEVTLRHELGAGDVRRIAVRANPTPQQCEALRSQLRAKKADLLQLRAQVAGQARTALAAEPAAETQATLDHLHAIERELSATENSLDQLYEMLRPGADRQADRRTRQACLDVAHARLDAIRSAVASAGIDADQRVRIIKPQFTAATVGGGQVVVVVIKKKS